MPMLLTQNIPSNDKLFFRFAPKSPFSVTATSGRRAVANKKLAITPNAPETKEIRSISNNSKPVSEIVDKPRLLNPLKIPFRCSNAKLIVE